MLPVVPQEGVDVPFQIAIDGPVAAGKGTVARLLASRLGFLYVDTGAMYRATALLAKQNGIDWGDAKALAEQVAQSSMILRNPLETETDGRLVTVLLDGKDVSWEIRTPEISQGSSVVAAHSEVRKELVKKQQEIAAQTDVVMEGRDITFRVLPNAQLKIYLDATQEARAHRRFQELSLRGIETNYEEVFKELKERDERDMSRAVDPLHATKDSWILDTSPYTIDQVVEKIIEKVQNLQKKS